MSSSEKNSVFVRVAKTLMLAASLMLLQACGASDSTDNNVAPIVVNVVITDTNGEITVVGDTLMASYVYADFESDAEGESAIRWLRNDVIISSATAMSYTLVDADAGKAIRFEVTPKAVTGTLLGAAATSNVINVISTDQAPSINLAPIASHIVLTDANGESALVGDTLVASYTYSDSENDAEGISAIRWLRNNVVISSTTAMSYTLVAADAGNNIKFEVTPTAVTGELIGIATTSNVINVVSAPAPNVNQAPTVSNVIISDTNGKGAVVGDTLVASYTYSDSENDAEGQSAIRWLRNNVIVSSAITMSYTLVDADAGKVIRFEVMPKAVAGTLVGIAATSNVINVMSPPINQAPTVSNVSLTDTNGDNAVVGDTLVGSYTYADDDNDTEGQSAIRWLRNNIAISRATGMSYTLVAADIDEAIRFEVTPKATAGELVGIARVSSIISVISAPINQAPTVSNVTITDTNGDNAVVGDTLMANYTYADEDNDTEGQSAIRWLRNDVIVSSAISMSYTLVDADAGKAIRFEVMPKAAAGTLVGIAATSNVINIMSTAVNEAPTVSNITLTDTNGDNAVVGDTLVASYTYADVEHDVEGPSAIRWLRNNDVINGASQLSYILTADDADKAIRFEVTPKAATGTLTGIAITSDIIIAMPGIPNDAPIVNNVTLTDTNGEVAVIGDSLLASYLYFDIESDVEGQSEIRWFRDNDVINGANQLSYILKVSDAGKAIRFAITPVAITGELTGISVISNVLAVPAIPTVAPITVISFPPEKSMTSSNSIVVRGSSTDASGIQAVTVNGVEAISDDGFTTWTAEVTDLSAGFNILTATTTDFQSDSSMQSVEIRSAALADEIKHLTMDNVGNRFFVIEKNQLISVEGTDGLTKRIDAVDSINSFNGVADMQYDRANNRMIVLDTQDKLSTIKQVDLATGARTIISQDSISEPEGTLSNQLYDLALDAANNTLYIGDGYKGIVEMNLTNGNRTVLTTPGVLSILFDAANSRLLATTYNKVISVDINTGVSTTLASSSIASATSNVSLNGLYGIAYDAVNNRVFVSTRNAKQIIKIDLTDGTRTLISDNTYDGDIDFGSPKNMEYDAANERVLVSDYALIGVDVNTGVRTKIDDSFGSIYSLGFDAVNNHAYAVKRGQSLVKFDIANGTSEIISDSSIATDISDTEFGDTQGMVLNLAAGVAYITDWSASSVIEVNLATGARTTIADNSTADVNNTFISPVALVLDDTNNRLLILDAGRGSLIEVDNNTGARRVISSAQIPNRVNAFREAKDMALDAANNRVLVLDSGLEAVVAVDLDTGARTIMGAINSPYIPWYRRLDLDTVNNRVLLVNQFDGLVEMNFAGVTNTIIDKDFYDIVFNPANSHAYILESDSGSGQVLEIVDVDLATTETVIVPTGVTPDNNLSLDDPFDIEINSDENVAYVSDTDRAAIISLNLDTGARTLLSDNTVSVGLSNIEFDIVKGIVLDAANNRLLVTDFGQKAIIAVALDTGARTLISDNTMEVASSNFTLLSPRYIALDAANNRVLVLDGPAVVAVSLVNGARTILSDADNGVGIDLSSQSDLTIDVAGNRVLVSDINRKAVIAVNLDTGMRTVLVDSSTPVEGSNGFHSPFGITIDPQNNRIILLDNWKMTVNAADLTSGSRTQLASPSGDNSFFISGTSSIVYDSKHNRALVVEKYRDAIIAVDLTTGARVIFSQ